MGFLSPLMELSHVRWPGRPTPRYWHSTLCVYYRRCRRVEEHDLIDSISSSQTLQGLIRTGGNDVVCLRLDRWFGARYWSIQKTDKECDFGLGDFGSGSKPPSSCQHRPNPRIRCEIRTKVHFHNNYCHFVGSFRSGQNQ